MNNGTVLKYLRDHGREDVDKLLLQVAEGLGYLHSVNIVHGDLRGANILVSGEGNAFKRTPASDVYALACVCLELYTVRPSFSDTWPDVAAMLKVVAGDRPTRDPSMSDSLWDLVTAAWAQDPRARPNMEEIVRIQGTKKDSELVQVEFDIRRRPHSIETPCCCAAQGPADSCDDINNCRKLFDIIWGCLTTIFACTWVSVHPNVPPPDQSWLALLWRRLKMMLIAVLAPELIVGFAARQFFGAWKFSKEYDVRLTHGFFFSMGGFVSQLGRPITVGDWLVGHLRY
ncbi:kinase-like domain-containing protein [Mycena rosella]|uniref:Kinase-like domain-containing protein n=1 Tax=Mycena rosella TaxID=1033263 RepID=A0AAD7DW92_MYCRO|nr:kinase-like domain-containing protein [Mycena rosella]